MTNVKEIRNGKLYFDGCDTVGLAQKYGTPLYVMSLTDIENRIKELKTSFLEKYENTRAAYAAKAFCCVGMCEILKKADLCIDVVSGGELYIAKKAMFPPENVEFNGNNKQPHEIDAAVEYGVGRIIVDGLNEIALIEEACKKHNKKMNIMLRITPGVSASTHDYIVTGKKDSKFGIPLEEDVFMPVVKQVLDSKYLEFTGLHMHIGSQLFEIEPYIESLDILMDWAEKIKDKFGTAVKEVNFGGGFGAVYTDEVGKPYSFFVDPLMERLDERSRAIGIKRPAAVIEPGRSLAAEAGITLYKTGQIKDIKGIRKYVSVDGGMGDNIRVALYQAEYEAVIANKADKKRNEKVTVSGKYCESGDILLKDLSVPDDIESGDIIAVFSTGAYGYSMASNYNGNTLPGVLLVKEGRESWMIKPQSYEHMIQNQLVPEVI